MDVNNKRHFHSIMKATSDALNSFSPVFILLGFSVSENRMFSGIQQITL